MLNNEIRQRLQQLINHYGHSVLDEPKRCEALLRDFIPEHKRELNLLVLSLREGIPQQLLKPAPHIGMNFTLQRLAQTLHDDLGMAEQFAFWAVESWALSLRVIQQPMTQTTQTQTTQPATTKTQVPNYQQTPKPQTNQLTPQIIQPTVQNKPEWRDPITGMEFVWIPAGSFMMGSPEDEADRRQDDEKQHHVTIQQGFYLAKTLVTQAQWQVVMGSNPSYFEGENLPVENVSWLDAQRFIQRLNHKSGQRYRLPTEAEWEYACRAGTTTAYYTGNDISHTQANFGRCIGKTTPVGSYPPNPWSLYDMAGNVWEWTASIYDENYRYSEQLSNINDRKSYRVLRGALRVLCGIRYIDDRNVWRVMRGGAWSSYMGNTRSANRDIQFHDTRGISIGFRLSLGQTGS